MHVPSSVIKADNVQLRPCKPHGHKDELIGDSAHGAVSGHFWLEILVEDIHALSYQVLPLDMIGSTCSLEILINLEDVREFALISPQKVLVASKFLLLVTIFFIAQPRRLASETVADCLRSSGTWNVPFLSAAW